MELVKVEVKNQIAQVTLNRPQLHNAFNDELIDELIKVFNNLEKDQSVLLVVLQGNGKSFCAGADLNWMKQMKDYSEKENFEDSQKLFELFYTIDQFPRPVLAKVKGAALGGGSGLVAVCDYVLAHEESLFGFTEVRLGLIPAVISPFVIQKIGISYARAYFLSGAKFKGKRAYEVGLVHELASTDEELEEKTTKIINEFLKAGPLAQMAAKDLIVQNRKYSIDQIKDVVCSKIATRRISKEGQEGMEALLEKRNAAWIKK